MFTIKAIRAHLQAQFSANSEFSLTSSEVTELGKAFLDASGLEPKLLRRLEFLLTDDHSEDRTIPLNVEAVQFGLISARDDDRAAVPLTALFRVQLAEPQKIQQFFGDQDVKPSEYDARKEPKNPHIEAAFELTKDVCESLGLEFSDQLRLSKNTSPMMYFVDATTFLKMLFIGRNTRSFSDYGARFQQLHQVYAKLSGENAIRRAQIASRAKDCKIDDLKRMLKEQAERSARDAAQATAERQALLASNHKQSIEIAKVLGHASRTEAMVTSILSIVLETGTSAGIFNRVVRDHEATNRGPTRWFSGASRMKASVVLAFHEGRTTIVYFMARNLTESSQKAIAKLQARHSGMMMFKPQVLSLLASDVNTERTLIENGGFFADVDTRFNGTSKRYVITHDRDLTYKQVWRMLLEPQILKARQARQFGYQRAADERANDPEASETDRRVIHQLIKEDTEFHEKARDTVSDFFCARLERNEGRFGWNYSPVRDSERVVWNGIADEEGREILLTKRDYSLVKLYGDLVAYDGRDNTQRFRDATRAIEAS